MTLLRDHHFEDERAHEAMSDYERDPLFDGADNDCDCRTMAECRACPRCSREELQS